MNFIEALKHIKDSGRVTLKEWIKKDKVQYISRSNDISKRSYGAIMLTTMLDNKFHTSYLFTNIDLMINGDWEIYEEQTKLFTFEQAISALKDGKDIKRKMWTTKVIKRDFCDDQSISFTIDDFEANDWIIIGG